MSALDSHGELRDKHSLMSFSDPIRDNQNTARNQNMAMSQAEAFDCIQTLQMTCEPLRRGANKGSWRVFLSMMKKPFRHQTLAGAVALASAAHEQMTQPAAVTEGQQKGRIRASTGRTRTPARA